MSVRQKSVKLGLAAVAASGLALTVLAPANADTEPGTHRCRRHLHPRHHHHRRRLRHHPMGRRPALQGLRQPAQSTPTVGLGELRRVPGQHDRPVRRVSATTPTAPGSPAARTTRGPRPASSATSSVVDPGVPPAGHALPSGSGDGRTLLRSPTDPLFIDVAYARSSGPINAADSARRRCSPSRSPSTRSSSTTHPGGPAPASLTGQQILKIYNGTYTNWNQVGGKKAPIHPYLPKAGSSTLNAFESFLAALDGDTEASGHRQRPGLARGRLADLAGPGRHDHERQLEQGVGERRGARPLGGRSPTPMRSSRSPTVGPSWPTDRRQTVRIEGGWSQDRELYHVVRGTTITGAGTRRRPRSCTARDGGVLENLFSNTGWVCNNATAQTDIANAGFWPLRAPAPPPATAACRQRHAERHHHPLHSHGVDEGVATTTNAFVQRAARCTSRVDR